MTSAPESVDFKSWRKGERAKLIAQRLAMPVEQRVEYSTRITALLLEYLPDVSGRIVSAYWPLRGEPDLRPWMTSVIGRGGRCALPVVVRKAAPLEFRLWEPGCRMEPGVWNIPVPAQGEVVTPDFLVAPVVGFDGACYRLGYGGGYFDRTLVTYSPQPAVAGVGYAAAALPTIYPQTYDIPMNVIITERCILYPSKSVPPTRHSAID
ncbi:MAG: 5-formyltetrahydrofolate cyclo-ligase [Pseudomonadota bacterium]